MNLKNLLQKFKKLIISVYRHLYIILNHSKIPLKNQLKDIDTINFLLNNKVSFLRWGDGETSIFYGKDIYFQKNNRILQFFFHNLLDKFEDNSKQILLGLPLYFLNKNPIELLLLKKLRYWYLTIYLFKIKKIKGIVGDAFVFRPLSQVSNLEIEKLWKNYMVILIVSDINLVYDFEKKYNNVFSKIIIPKSNAFQFHASILKEVESVISNLKPTVEYRFLISAGPYAKYLGFIIATKGYIIYDVGNYFTWKYKEIQNLKGI